MKSSEKYKIKIGSRGSPLACKQVEEVLDDLASLGIKISFEHQMFETKGDKDKSTSLSINPADDFFTDSLDDALLKHDIDVAVHSAKDLPKHLSPGLKIFALTQVLNDTDSLVSLKKISELPPGCKIGTSSPVRAEALKAFNPFIETVDVRGNIAERIALVDSGQLDGVIVATCALERLNLTHRVTETMPWETTPLQGQLAVVGREEDHERAQLFSAIDVRRDYGRVFLVGAGPGDPDLITLKGVEVLKKADCVFYDYLVDPGLLNFASQAEHIYVGKRKGEHTLSQSQLCRMLREKAVSGKNVVRLKGGDPLIFGRGAEEIEYLSAFHIEHEIVPGVSSATGLPSMLGIPLTARGISSSVAFVSGHEEKEKSEEQKAVDIPQADTVIFLMGLTKLKSIVQSLLLAKRKPETPVLVISKGTRVDEKIVTGTILTIEDIVANEHLEPPALIIVGEVVKFWNPAKTKTSQTQEPQVDKILYLGTNPQKYEALGQIIHVPMIDIAPALFSQAEKKDLVEQLKQNQLAVFTSRFAVIHLMEILEEQQAVSVLKKMECAVIGADTAGVLVKRGISPKLISDIETSQGLFEALEKAYDLRGKRIFFPRSSLPNSYLKKALSARGAKVTEITIYENKKAPAMAIPVENINKILFTSPSTVRYFISTFGSIPPHWQILSKGPHTSEALTEAGYESEILVYE